MSQAQVPGAAHPPGPLHLRRWLLACLVLLAAAPVLAQSIAAYDLSWSTVDGGGSSGTGGIYTLEGTAGQPDAGLMAGGEYVLAGGFWPGGGMAAPQPALYLPLILRAY